ncbi:isocitrate/isopropylmalate dehydrogenase family protein [Corynebacterium lubricantis]|uniref:isocitrate/isopropylmalate dehydrogenase family protein n=1 Tax=Corynebacterium lubricantis TaxID=541095 RepID=UPI000377CA16|nr:isocitrate/isopropylmalate dehydrogenase family protein [Corynebacterium lubricantis]
MSKASYKIAVLPGDGIGPEVIDASIQVLNHVAENNGIGIETEYFDAGAKHYEKTGHSITPEDMDKVGEADAMLLGAMGDPVIRHPDGTEINPQIEMREYYGLFASLRPARLYPEVPTNVRSTDIDMVVIRETTEGLFAGRLDPMIPSDEESSDRLTITRATSEKLFRLAFDLAATRKETHGTPGKVTLLDKANVLRSNAFMRKVFKEIALEYPELQNECQYIDSGSMMLVTNPERFDVVVTENVFGDITSEIAAGVVGGLGVAPSGDVSLEHGVFQPCHGTAPDIAGQGVANPVATILSVAMMLEWLGQQHNDERLLRAATDVTEATKAVLSEGIATRDLGGDRNTQEVTSAVIERLAKSVSVV